MDDIIRTLKLDYGSINQQKYAAIIGALQELGYTGRPERWHGNTKRKISVVLPEKVQWFVDNAESHRATPEQVRDALRKGGVWA